LSVQRERAVLVKVLAGKPNSDSYDPLAELRLLAKAAGAIVVDGLTQRLNRVNPKTYIGKGKTAELGERVRAGGANLIIFDNDLSPAQIRELERQVECKILDRSELILDIFASRARTHEAKLQVELAQLEYTAPRLRGMWTHLERIAGAGGGSAVGAVGGIGTRGPGEKQIEIDRRIVRDRVAALRRELSHIERRKIQTVRSRSDCFTVSLVGYTNSGKSTLLNALTDAGAYTADKLFATLDTKTVRWEIDECCTVLLSDTVGFVRDLPHRLVASFRATLEEAMHANLLLHVIDASNPRAAQQVAAVGELLDELGCTDVPTVALLNKIDAVQDEADVRLVESFFDQAYRISALTGEGLDQVVDAVRRAASSNALAVTLRMPAGDGRALAAVDNDARVLDRRYVQDVVELDVVIDRRHLDRLLGQHDTLEVVSTNGPSQAAAETDA
ncbi:MAG: GTPase HflX, partial [Phycisphaerae bacterium]